MSARIAGYILILQSEKNHDSVERLNLADRITEVEKAKPPCPGSVSTINMFPLPMKK